jgi:hypothetical protein
MNRSHLSCFTCCLLAQVALAGASPAAPMLDPDFAGWQAAPLFLAATEGGADDALYREGQSALDDARWDVAAARFSKVAKAGGAQADAALYWQAYAEHRLGRDRDALATLDRLTLGHAESAWRDDAEALRIELGGPAARAEGGREAATAGAGESSEDELKLYALNALMNVEPERALPLLRKVLAGNASLKVREQALFVLSQHASREAASLLAEVARGNAQPELQEKALEYLGMSDNPENLRLLEDVYRATSRREVKEKVLDGFMMAGAGDRLLSVARSEKDLDLRGRAIDRLGMMDANDALHELFRQEPDVAVRAKIVQALAIAGDTAFLTEAARDSHAEIRRQAIQGLGMDDSPAAGAQLERIYRAGDHEAKRAVLDAFMIRDDAKGLIAVAKSESDRELRREALERLSMMDSDEAQAFLLKALE